jgi:putative FmdB family regulatory protein
MPTYQYRCEKCGEMFEHAEHLAEHATVQSAEASRFNIHPRHLSRKRPERAEICLTDDW